MGHPLRPAAPGLPLRPLLRRRPVQSRLRLPQGAGRLRGEGLTEDRRDGERERRWDAAWPRRAAALTGARRRQRPARLPAPAGRLCPECRAVVRPARAGEGDRVARQRRLRQSACHAGSAPAALDPRPTGSVAVAGLGLDGWRLFWALVASGLACVLMALASLRVRASVRAVPTLFERWPRTAWGVTLGALVAIVAVGVPLQSAVLLERDGGGEPFAWFECVSLWPTEIIRVIAILTAVVLIIRVFRTLKRASRSIEGEFFEVVSRESTDTGRNGGWLESVFGLSMRDDDDRSDIETYALWRRYRHRTAARQRFSRI